MDHDIFTISAEFSIVANSFFFFFCQFSILGALYATLVKTFAVHGALR